MQYSEQLTLKMNLLASAESSVADDFNKVLAEEILENLEAYAEFSGSL